MHEQLFHTLDRLLKKGVVREERFYSIPGTTAEDFEYSANSRGMQLFQKSPDINKKPNKPSNKFSSQHYAKVHSNSSRGACNEFLGSILTEFAYPNENIAPKNRLVIPTEGKHVGSASKSIDSTRLTFDFQRIARNSKFTAQEFGVGLRSLCKVMVLSDFIGATDNHEGNIRKSAGGHVIRIDFESISPKPISFEHKSSALNSCIDEGIYFTDEYVSEVEKLANLKQTDLDRVLEGVERIFDMYSVEPDARMPLIETYKNRISEMGSYAIELRAEKNRRQQLSTLANIVTRAKDLGICEPKKGDSNATNDPYRAASWMLSQAEEYKNQGLTLNDIVKVCLGLEADMRIDPFEFQVLFILNAQNNPAVRNIIDMAKEHESEKGFKERSYPIYELVANGHSDIIPKFIALQYNATFSSACLDCKAEDIGSVIRNMGLQLREMGIQNASFTHSSMSMSRFKAYPGSFDAFVQHCQGNFIRYNEAVLDYQSAEEERIKEDLSVKEEVTMKEETCSFELLKEKFSSFKLLFHSLFNNDSDQDDAPRPGY